jgi:hypothetical protein
VRDASGGDGHAGLQMTEREALAEAAMLHSPTRRPTDPTDVEPHHLSAELLDALSCAKNQARPDTG